MERLAIASAENAYRRRGRHGAWQQSLKARPRRGMCPPVHSRRPSHGRGRLGVLGQNGLTWSRWAVMQFISTATTKACHGVYCSPALVAESRLCRRCSGGKLGCARSLASNSSIRMVLRVASGLIRPNSGTNSRIEPTVGRWSKWPRWDHRKVPGTRRNLGSRDKTKVVIKPTAGRRISLDRRDGTKGTRVWRGAHRRCQRRSSHRWWHR